MKKIRVRLIGNVLIGIVIVVCIVFFYTTFSLDNEYEFSSDVYVIEDNYIKGISINTDVSLFVNYFDVDNCSFVVVDRNDKKIESGYVGSGSKVVIYDKEHVVVGTYVNVIKGDFNGDGLIDSNDFYVMGESLVKGYNLDDYLGKVVDINDDGVFLVNDLVLLDSAIKNGYSNIELDNDNILLQSNEERRLVVRVEPSYGVNKNVNWVSMDESIATVDNVGRVVGHNEGEVIVKAITLDGKYEVSANVVVDNTIQLDSLSGTSYIGGNDKVVKIKAIDYEGISCVVSKEEVADCLIENNSLILKGKSVGSTDVIVRSVNYGEVVYNLNVYSVYLNVIPKYLCMTPNNVNFITVSGFNTGELTVDILDKEIVNSAYMEMVQNRRMLRINAGSKQGRVNLKITENNGNTSNVVVVDVTSISMADIGKVAMVGEEINTVILGDNLGELSCKSSDEEVGSCKIDGNKLFVTGLKKGTVTVDVYNEFVVNGSRNSCGKAQFIVLVQE